MFFSVRDLELRKARFDVAIPPGQIEFLDEQLHQATPIEAEGSVELLASTLGEIRVRGRLKAGMEAECDRCLETARFSLDAPFDLYYRPNGTVRGRDEISIHEGESEVGFYEGGGLELNDVLREQILLMLPMQRVCEESCKGICPVCGQNRNQADCACHAKLQDDRWSALENL
ncbi:MAG: YceD family protein [Pseudomonadota bacterium]